MSIQLVLITILMIVRVSSCENTFWNYYSSSALVFEPRDEDKGDVARIIFYMDIRYEGR